MNDGISSKTPNEPEHTDAFAKLVRDRDEVIEEKEQTGMSVDAPIVKEETTTVPVVSQPTVTAVVPAQNSGGSLVLQWLTYAFWGWFCIALCWIAGTAFTYFVTHSTSPDWGNMLAYPLAATSILLIIALVTDMLYSRHEPVHKTGGANVIMLLHVVPFVLFAIGGLVTVVFCFITMMLNSDPVSTVDGPLITLYTALVGVVIYAMLAARIFFGGKKPLIRKFAWVGFGMWAIAFVIAAFAGPASVAMRTKQDRLIEQALPTLSSDIREYVQKNNKLPAALTDVTHNESSSASAVQQLMDQHLVTYKANTLPPKDSSNSNYLTSSATDSEKMGVSVSSGVTSNSWEPGKTYYYQLCTSYKAEKKSSYSYTSVSEVKTTTNGSAGSRADYLTDSIYRIDSHAAGPVCYNLYANTGSYYAY